jgi:hypothetical protein
MILELEKHAKHQKVWASRSARWKACATKEAFCHFSIGFLKAPLFIMVAG